MDTVGEANRNPRTEDTDIKKNRAGRGSERGGASRLEDCVRVNPHGHGGSDLKHSLKRNSKTSVLQGFVAEVKVKNNSCH